MSFLKQIFSIVDCKNKELINLVLFFIFLSLLDVVGIGLIAPYFALISGDNTYSEYLLYMLVDFGFSDNENNVFIFSSVILLATFFVKTIVAIMVNRNIISFSLKQEFKLKTKLMGQYQSMPYVEYIARDSSEYIYNIQVLTSQYTNQVLSVVLRMSGDFFVSIAIVSLLAYQDIQMLMTLLLVFFLIVFFYDLVFKRKVMLYGKLSNKHISRMISGISEGMRGFKEIRVLGRERYFYNAVGFNAAKSMVYSFKNQVLSVVPRHMIEFGLIIFVVMVVLKSTIISSDISELIPTLAVFAVAAMRLVPIANSVSTSLLHLRHGKNTVDILYRDLNKGGKTPVDTCADTESDFVSLEVKRLSFYYAKSKEKILTDISLKINSGDAIGFIGHSGSGKTTLIDVMLGLLPVFESGSILYNGRPLVNHVNELHSHVAYIPQEVFLINDTLRNNIALGVEKEGVDEDAVRDAISKSRLDMVVSKFQDGLNTLIGENGIKLSGGQRQRIALARAFYHKRDVLIMDESTSALDNEIEEEVLKEIKRLKRKKTLIVIAHRYTTLRYCDHIYELENGRIIDSGSYKKMILEKDRI